MISKIKSYLTLFLTAFAAIFYFLFSREKTKRKEAEEKASAAEAKNEAVSEVLSIQQQINAATQKVAEANQKQPKKPNKIILPILVFVFVVVSACTNARYIAVSTAPELYAFESGIELLLDEDSGNYCMTEDEALRLQKILTVYKEQIDIYNKWRIENAER